MAIAEITRAETRERARLLRVDDYRVELDLTRGDEVFGSVSVVRFSCREPGASSYADLVAEQVHEITLNGLRLDPAEVYCDGRIALAGLAERNELRVAADCRYASDGTAMHRTVDTADGRVYLYTKFEPAAARRVFANFEQPDLKASFAFTIIAPAHWIVLSCQPAPDPDPEPAGTDVAVWRFAPTPRISTYLPALWQTRSHQARLVLGQVLFPYTASPPELLERIGGFLAAGERDPGLVRLLIERRDLIERTLRSRALTGP